MKNPITFGHKLPRGLPQAVLATTGLLLLTGCYTAPFRQSQADDFASDWLSGLQAAISDELGDHPPQNVEAAAQSITDSSDEILARIGPSPTSLRAYTDASDQMMHIVLWVSDTGADPFTDDVPVWGRACAVATINPGERPELITLEDRTCPQDTPRSPDTPFPQHLQSRP